MLLLKGFYKGVIVIGIDIVFEEYIGYFRGGFVVWMVRFLRSVG